MKYSDLIQADKRMVKNIRIAIPWCLKNEEINDKKVLIERVYSLCTTSMLKPGKICTGPDVRFYTDSINLLGKKYIMERIENSLPLFEDFLPFFEVELDA